LSNNHRNLITELPTPTTKPTYRKQKKYLTLDEEEANYNTLSNGKDSHLRRELGKIKMK